MGSAHPIWTDAAQAFVMIGGMAVVLAAAWARVGNPVVLWGALGEVDPALLQWVPNDLSFGFGTYVAGFVFGGFGVVGQPHILARSMAIESPEAVRPARRIYFAWYLPFSVLAVTVGLYSRVLLPGLAAGVTESAGVAAQTAELAFPQMTITLLPDALVGLVIAGLFSATMSTADSQVLSCSAAVTQDVAPRWRESYFASKASTTAITLIALTIALSATEGVFDLVLGAWSALGASLGPLVLLRVFGRHVPTRIAVTMMISGLATVWLWDHSPWSDDVFKLFPGMAVPLLVYVAANLWRSVVTSRLRSP
ncbi:MAG: hypothetical protein WBG86_21440 [Polyangiales bacterium]